MEAHTATLEEALATIAACEALLRQDPDDWRARFAELQAFFDDIAAQEDPSAWIAERWQACHQALKTLKALKAHVSGGLDEDGEVYAYYFDVVIDGLMGGEEEPFQEQVEARLATLLDTDAPVLSEEDDPVAHTAASLQDTLEWVHGHGDENDFVKWLRGELAAPVKMNCFDSVFYAAFRAGAVTREAIVAAYADVLGGAGYASVETALGLGQGISMEAALEQGGLKPGDVIIFNGDAAAHVALCLGGGDVMSLWSQNGGKFGRLKLTAIMGDTPLSAMTVAPKGATIFG
jgi:hypothetical protein